VLRAAIAEIIAVNAGDYDILQFHGSNRLCKVQRFVSIRGRWPSMCHVTKRAPAGAEIAQNHECGGTFAETLADVGTGRLFAYGMEFLFAKDSLDFIKLLAVR